MVAYRSVMSAHNRFGEDASRIAGWTASSVPKRRVPCSLRDYPAPGTGAFSAMSGAGVSCFPEKFHTPETACRKNTVTECRCGHAASEQGDPAGTAAPPPLHSSGHARCVRRVQSRRRTSGSRGYEACVSRTGRVHGGRRSRKSGLSHFQWGFLSARARARARASVAFVAGNDFCKQIECNWITDPSLEQTKKRDMIDAVEKFPDICPPEPALLILPQKQLCAIHSPMQSFSFSA